MKTKILAVLTAGMLVLLMTSAQGKSGGSSASYLQMTIVNSANLTGDGLKTYGGNSIYTDFHLADGDKCVTATLSNGSVKVQQNYVISTHPKVVWCNAQSGASTPRYWNIVIEDAAACQTVFGSNASAPCTFSGSDMTNSDYENVVPGDAFSSSSSQVIMQFTLGGGATGYSVRTDGTANITPGSLKNTRVVTYNGGAQLYHGGEPTGTGHFDFAFQLVLEKF